jgi:uncharacterized membrane protein YfhO
VEVVRRGDSELRCTVEASAPGYLRIAESFDPGWRAWVDGRRVPLLCADVGFQAVAVDGGRHEVRLSYEPRRVGLGLAASGLGALGIIGGVVRLRRRRDG